MENEIEKQLVRAWRSAQRTVESLQAAHRATCVDKPTPAQRLAEAQLLSLLADAVKLRDVLKGVVK